jgi:hypothetical protein
VQSVSTEDGIQIDSKNLHWPKANRPIDRRVESDSNSTVISLPFREQQNGRSSPIEAGIKILSGEPITKISERLSKSTRNSSGTLNESDSLEVPIETIPESSKAVPSIDSTEAGTKSQFKDRQLKNTEFSTVASLNGRSKITDPRDPQL